MPKLQRKTDVVLVDKPLEDVGNYSRSTKSPFKRFVNWFKQQDETLREEMTFASKKQKAAKINWKQVGVYALLLLTLMGSLITIFTLGTAGYRDRQLANKGDKSLDRALVEKSQLQEAMTLKKEDEPEIPVTEVDRPEDKPEDKPSEEQPQTQEVDQAEIDRRVKEEIDKRTTDIVNEYNRKLDEATASMQAANEKANTATQNRDALSRELEETKSKLAEAERQLQQLKTETVAIPNSNQQ